jgi:hypothetical protein
MMRMRDEHIERHSMAFGCIGIGALSAMIRFMYIRSDDELL